MSLTRLLTSTEAEKGKRVTQCALPLSYALFYLLFFSYMCVLFQKIFIVFEAPGWYSISGLEIAFF